MEQELKVRKLLEEFEHLFGKQSTNFKRGWIQGAKYMRKAELDEFVDELYNDIEQEKYIQKEQK